ncbi:virulence factor TspB C-terminal domain-related protein [Vibrio variabilis]|uniref:virulence factor TspB C-terminal domain-related protein n=1 Tax=Vibrio variabilis TaxID=990271 RepID=UPI0013A6ACF6|nr:virulence factor TspB C-terminal domain-related protein [Vibrio variabilis]
MTDGSTSLCPDQQPDGSCSTPPPPPTECPEAGTNFKKLNGRSGLEGYSSCVSSNCVVALTAPDLQVCTGADTQESCPYTATYTGQACDSSANAGIKPPDYQWPSVTIPDNGITNPDAPSLPTDRPDGASGGSNGGGNVTDGDIKPNPEPTPTPDNPNLSEADNALLAEQSLTTQHVENIEYSVDQLRQETSDNAALKTEYDKRILGELESLNGSGQLGDSELKQSLDAIGCALDPKLCADGNGDGDGGGDGNGEGENGVGANGCEAFSCNGDAVVCYLAEQQWREQCGKDFFDQGTDQEIQKGLDEFIKDNPVELIEAGELDISNVLNKYQGKNGIEIKGGCPSPQRFDVMGKFYEIEFKPFCDLAGIIKVLLMAFTLVSCGLLIAKYGL